MMLWEVAGGGWQVAGGSRWHRYEGVPLALRHARARGHPFGWAPAGFMYLWTTTPEPHLFDIIGLPGQAPPSGEIHLPGQLLLSAARTELTGEAIRGVLCSPTFQEALAGYTQNNLVILPVLREGAKYRIGNALFKNYGFYCDEVLVDSHHVFDPSVPRYSRRVETTIVKDQISPRRNARRKPWRWSATVSPTPRAPATAGPKHSSTPENRSR